MATNCTNNTNKYNSNIIIRIIRAIRGQIAFGVKGVAAKDSMIVFQNGFKFRGDKNGGRFYEVMYSGNVKLLKHFKAEEIKKDIATANMAPEYEMTNEY